MLFRVVHVDMDAFFASVEERSDPRLVGRPIAVGGGPEGRGVVTTASYPARAFGIRSGMSMDEARRRCPDLILRPVDPPRYIHAFECLLRLFETFTPVVEPASIDEVFLDLDGLGLDDAGCLRTAHAIQEEVARRERLSCSLGLGRSRVTAKMASGLRKPGGITALTPAEFARTFHPRPTSDLWGVGSKTARRLEETGYRTIGDLAGAPASVMERLFGVAGRVLIRLAHGEGGGPIVTRGGAPPARSMGHETTLSRDVRELPRLESQLLLLSDRLSRRLRREDVRAHTVRLRIKWSEGSVLTHQRTLVEPVDDGRTIHAVAKALLRDVHEGRSVRLIGVSCDHLVRGQAPLPLFPGEVRRRAEIRILDRLRDRFGESSLIPGGVLPLFPRGREKEPDP